MNTLLNYPKWKLLFRLIGVLIIFFIFFFHSFYLIAQNESLQWYSTTWNAHWIAPPDINQSGIGVFHFRKDIELSTKPESFIIHISADNRYKLYVNGQYVTNGPARGDLMKWRYETLDIAPYLNTGKNVIGAIVWNMGHLSPVAQFSRQTGLIIQGATEKEEIINTNDSWRVIQSEAYDFNRIDHLRAYYVVGPGETFDSRQYHWNWQSPEVDMSTWSTASILGRGQPLKALRKYGSPSPWPLFPREIPLMEYNRQKFKSVRRAKGINVPDQWLSGNQPITIPANTSASILLDQGVLTTAYPQLSFVNGKGSSIKITYAESLYETTTVDGQEEYTQNKGNRNEISGKEIWGNEDLIIADGDEKNVYEPLWWRTFRYVQLDITTKNEALKLFPFESYFTAYPLKNNASFRADYEQIDDIFEVGWRTQRLCAAETFFDCPYYEQLQYVGDTRIQGLVTFFISGDTLLWRKSIQDFYDSRLPFGLTQSRYPSRDMQIIPTYSLAWITMLYDYMLYGNDDDFVGEKIPAVIDILNWFDRRLDENGLHDQLEGWNFVDWVVDEGWDAGVPPLNNDKHSSIIAAQYVYTIKKAVAIFDHFGHETASENYQQQADELSEKILATCWNESRGLLADTPKKDIFSQHANILGVLADIIPQEKQKDLIASINQDTSIAAASYYFKFYLAEALKKTGQGDQYLNMLSPWKAMLDNGLTTFMEEPEPSRSDCHAWSASPLYHFYTIVCGITATSPGFTNMDIQPNFGSLTEIDARFPHRLGEVVVSLKKSRKGALSGFIELPVGCQGKFQYGNLSLSLVPGRNLISSRN